jgi:hypothetical protein
MFETSMTNSLYVHFIANSKSLVSSCPDNEPLSLQVRRGTTVVVDHEAALTELCANPDTSDAETEQCVLEYLQGGYSDNDYLLDDTSNDMVECDNEQECLLDNMQSMWAEDDIDAVENANGAKSQTKGSGTTAPSNATVTTPKPWSSRTSPSGTFVRDPATRQMRNIG